MGNFENKHLMTAEERRQQYIERGINPDTLERIATRFAENVKGQLGNEADMTMKYEDEPVISYKSPFKD